MPPASPRALHLVFHGVRCLLSVEQESMAERLATLYGHATLYGDASTEAWRSASPGVLCVVVQTGTAVPPEPANPRIRLIADRLIWGELEDGRLVLSDGRSAAEVDYGAGHARIDLCDDRKAALYVATHRLVPIVLSELLRTKQVYYLHAASIVNERGQALLVVGDSEAGKSTLTYAALRSGLLYMADDGVLLGKDPQGMTRAQAFYRELSLDPECMGPEDRARSAPNEPLHTGDSRHHLRPPPHSCASEAVVVGVLVVKRTRGPSRLEAASRGEIYEELLRQNPFAALVPELAAEHLRALRRLLETASTFIVHSGPDLLAEPGLARDVLKAAFRS